MPLVAFLLTACPNNGGGGSGTGGGGGGGGQTQGQGTEASPYSFEELMNVAEKLSSGAQGSAAIYATGKVVAGVDTYSEATPKVREGRTSFHVGTSSKSILVFNANDADNAASYNTTPVKVGDTVLFTGVLMNYNGTLEVCYVKDVGNCQLLKVNGNKSTGTGSGTGGGGGGTTTSGGFAGANASTTGSVPTGAKTIEFTLNDSTITGISGTSSKSPDASGVATVNGYDFNYANCIKHAASSYITPGYLGLCSGTPKAASWIANKTAIPGEIVKVEIQMPSDVSAGSGSVSSKAAAVCDFGTSALGVTSATEGQTGGSGVTMSAYSTIKGSYFAINNRQGTNDKGAASWYNFYISKIIVTYVAK